MSGEGGTRPPLFEAILDAVATDATPFDRTDSPSPGTLLLRSACCDDLAVVKASGDTDPHSTALVRTAHRQARRHDAARFATVNPTDCFVFSPSESGGFDRAHYDLRGRTLDSFVRECLTAQSTPVGTPPADLLLGRLRSFHASLARLYEARIAERFGRDDQLTAFVRSWATDDSPGDESIRALAREYAYARVNRILCYELLRTQTAISLDSLQVAASAPDLEDTLTEQFATAVDACGCESLFRVDAWAAIPDDERTRQCRSEFIESLAAEPLGGVDSEIVGRLYEAVVSNADRTRLGQFYTPDTIGEILSGWAIRSADDQVLDPCSGAGALTLAASDRLAELGDGDSTGGVTAVDIESVPIQLTALNHRLAGRPAGELSTHHADFFDLEPTPEVTSEQSAVGDCSDESTAIGPFDATVANPPYVRQEAISDERAHFRAHLSAFDADESEVPLDRRCDLYCYFLTHATQFLADGARLAWIVPTKWLTADYGTEFQRFLFDHYSVDSIVGFGTSLFDDAVVDTVLLLAQRRRSESDRLATKTKFVRITDSLSADAVLDILGRDSALPADRSAAIESDSHARIVTVRQSSLVDRLGTKLQPYLSAPSLYVALCEHGDCLPLAECATVTRGVKTGANPIFLLEEETIDSFGIDRRFCRPAIKTVRAVDGFEQTAADADRWLLDFHSYVTERGVGVEANAVTEALRADGYDGVVAYLSWADDQPARENRSLESHEPWFDLGSLDGATAPIICPQAMDTRRFFARTDRSVVPSNRFLLVDPSDGVDETLLLGLLNSSLSQIVVESHGRVTGGGAINLSGSDLESFPVCDPDALSPAQATAISEGFERLAAGDSDGRTEIDRAVAEALDLDVSVAEVATLSHGLKRSRRTTDQTADSFIDDTDAVESRLELSFE